MGFKFILYIIVLLFRAGAEHLYTRAVVCTHGRMCVAVHTPIHMNCSVCTWWNVCNSTHIYIHEQLCVHMVECV